MTIVPAACTGLALGVLLLLTACDRGGDATAERIRMYTCGHHPEVQLPHPGLCPVCDEPLVPAQPVPTATLAVRAPELDVPRQ